ncbi:carboxypeptidase-like regulatory domain-containing protein [Jejuia pallidilutea]|uniref:TonB-dependent receptor putative n=1 Tax=Jejuia pallidilutea TaxID=504487 RepID=A0A090WT30_9FLAO|nr:carboxypeptidase-like regulatory domain-containing protein [Jejuia pallidilutea]GAL70552.1 TonB-dependent receptor putative [Jejuia pallidilutea]
MYFKTNIYYLLFIALFSAYTSIAQINGKIVDERNVPLEYATAALFNKNNNTLIAGVISNEDGVFKFEGVKKGTYYLEASFLGYEKTRIDAIVVNSKGAQVDLATIKLVLGTQLNEVIVKAERNTVVNKIDRQVFEASNLKMHRAAQV